MAGAHVETEFEAALALDHGEQTLAFACAKARLARLTVAELRVLATHYFGPCDAHELRKADLIEELADQLVDDER